MLKNIILSRLRHRQEELETEKAPYKEREQRNLTNIQQAVAGLGYIASVTDSEIVFHVHSVEAARELDRKIYEGSFTIQKTPLPGTGGMWEVRVSDG